MVHELVAVEWHDNTHRSCGHALESQHRAWICHIALNLQLLIVFKILDGGEDASACMQHGVSMHGNIMRQSPSRHAAPCTHAWRKLLGPAHAAARYQYICPAGACSLSAQLWVRAAHLHEQYPHMQNTWVVADVAGQPDCSHTFATPYALQPREWRLIDAYVEARNTCPFLCVASLQGLHAVADALVAHVYCCVLLSSPGYGFLPLICLSSTPPAKDNQVSKDNKVCYRYYQAPNPP